jgi:predicted HTH transcriptional regulator
MDDQALEKLLDDLESDRVERKASIANKDKICEAICAFANDLPNHLLKKNSEITAILLLSFKQKTRMYLSP